MRHFLILLCIAFLSYSDSLTIALQPLGTYPKKEIQDLKRYLTKDFAPAKVIILPPKELPAMAWYPVRSRYRADSLLVWLNAQDNKGYDKVLALTSKDISTTKGEHVDWGIIGLANISGRAAVVSLHRLKKSGVTYDTTLRRWLKSCKHELGHTLGLGHCAEEVCVMRSYDGTLTHIDASDGSFCSSCTFLYEMGRGN